MSNLVDHARRELELIGAFDKDKDFYGGMTGTAVLKMVEIFAEEGHSGMSANLCISLFERVARFEPLSPLRGTDDEWNEVGSDSDMTHQNKRCPHVFKGADGRAYDSEAVIFRDPDGGCFTSAGSRKYIEFPYVPTHEYVERQT